MNMENNKLRKERKKGEVTQKCFTFRLDNTNIPILEGVPNKGRFINEAIWQYHEHLKEQGLWKYYQNL